jgi:16S rRNA (uracil1498-N3)-methyltransferase
VDRAVPSEELSARRFFAAELPGQPGELTLDAVAQGHLRVLRLKGGDQVTLFDGRGGSVAAEIVDAKRGTARTLGPLAQVAARPFVGLVLCVPKAHKIDDIVRMTSELGVSAIWLALSERSPARPKEDRDAHKLERLGRVAIEAARQSEQAYLPELRAPQPLARVLAELPSGPARIALVERSDARFAPPEGAHGLWLLVGPEGGLSHRDRGELDAAGFVPGGLGPSILRTETAAVVGVGLARDWLARASNA